MTNINQHVPAQHSAFHTFVVNLFTGAMLVAAGFAPIFMERPFGDPALRAAREAVDLVLKGHQPFPALAVDRHWTLLSANGAVARLLEGAARALLQPPLNVLRLTLHPEGLASRIVNFTEWRSHILERLRCQFLATADATVDALIRELSSYPDPHGSPKVKQAQTSDYGGVLAPFSLRVPDGVLNLYGTTTVFGTAVDITLAELTLEVFFPADPASAAMLTGAAARDATASQSGLPSSAR